jgi:hypothetical protein
MWDDSGMTSTPAAGRRMREFADGRQIIRLIVNYFDEISESLRSLNPSGLHGNAATSLELFALIR